jgi:hypothetical protein
LLVGGNVLSVAGAGFFIPVVWTVTGARRSWPAPPPQVVRRIQDRPPAYQEAFRVAYAERLAQRRHRAALVGGVAGGVTGVAAIVGLFLYAFSNWGG